MTTNNKYAIYGAGNIGKKIFSIISNNNIGNVEYFFDEYSALESVEGKPVIRLSDIETNKLDIRDTIIIISIFNPYTNLAEVKRNLSSYNFSAIIDFYSFYKQNAEFFDDLFWLSKPEKMINDEKLNQVFENLSDQKSRTLFNSIISFRKNLELNSIPGIEQHPQYIPDDINMNLSNVSFADCGAYTGDTIEAISGVYNLENIYCFEPDSDNFQILRQNISRLSIDKKFKSYLWPCGVWNTNTQLSFQSSDAAGKISESGEFVIQTVALDDILMNADINYIKMDVEGAELNALHGAEKIIKVKKPALAICVYHKPEDIWEIPLYIKSIIPEYKLYLRQYGENLFETVLYAVLDSND